MKWRALLVVEVDLLEALDESMPLGEMRDMFAQEPLAQERFYWQFPKMTITSDVVASASRA